MAAPQASRPVWVWKPADAQTAKDFSHPADLPADERMAHARFVEGVKGPRLARIAPAKQLAERDKRILVAEQGVTREISKCMTLHWYEGLLLLQELERLENQVGRTAPRWYDAELREILKKERAIRGGQVSAVFYAEKAMAGKATTGAKFIDSDGVEWSYLREGVRGDDSIRLEGDSPGLFRIREVAKYMPPWEAFCNERCGFYQDFYQVLWGGNHSKEDYSGTENGCPTVGATWEPDECLPPCLDTLRVDARKKWAVVTREREFNEKKSAESARIGSLKRPSFDSEAGANRPGSLKRPSFDAEARASPESSDPEADRKPVKLRRLRRDGAPLNPDMFREKIGHDFLPPKVEEQADLRAGWPKAPSDYPPGYGCADPPGFCKATCDCMDDMRGQQLWELQKPWLNDNQRTADAAACIDHLAKQVNFVTRRGLVSKICFFETAYTNMGDLTHARAASNLASAIRQSLREVLGHMPVDEFGPGRHPVVPAAAFLSGELDYEPLRYDAAPTNGHPLPSWLTVGQETGALKVMEKPPPIESPINFSLGFEHIEGQVAAAPCRIVGELHPERPPPWVPATGQICARFSDQTACPLLPGIRNVVREHLSALYDFSSDSVRDHPLGAFLEIMGRILRMLRVAAASHVVPRSV